MNKNKIETIEVAGETLTLIEKEREGNWYSNEDAEEIYISREELSGELPHFTQW